MNNKVFAQRVTKLSRSAVVERLEGYSHNENSNVLYDSQAVILNHVSITMLKSFFSDNNLTLMVDYVFFIVHEGHFKIRINMEEHLISRYDIGYFTDGVIARINDFSKDLDMSCIIVSSDMTWHFFKESLPPQIAMLANAMYARADKCTLENLDMLLCVVKNVMNSMIHDSSIVLSNLFSSFVRLIDAKCSMTAKFYINIPDPTKDNHSRVALFLYLVKSKCCIHHKLEFYAKELCISPQHLCNIVATVTGLSAKKLLDAALAWHIKMFIVSDGLSLEQIATKTNFADVFAMKKFFKRETGLSIREYKKKIDTLLKI